MLFNTTVKFLCIVFLSQYLKGTDTVGRKIQLAKATAIFFATESLQLAKIVYPYYRNDAHTI